MLEFTVRADPRQLAPVRHRVIALLRSLHRSDEHVWRVSIVTNELLALSIRQGNRATATLRLLSFPESTRVELVDDLQDLAAFDAEPGRIVTRVADIWGVVRDQEGTRTVWCDVVHDTP
jgi:hypothetical protein